MKSLAQRAAQLFAPKTPAQKHSLPAFEYGQTFLTAPGKPVWSGRSYTKFAEEAYRRNVVAHRCIHLIASGAASVGFKLVGEHPQRDAVMKLLRQPSPFQSGAELMESVYGFRLIAGNAFMEAVGPADSPPAELYALRPDRVSVIAGMGGVPQGYRYTVGTHSSDFPVNRMTGASRILHLKSFHPLDDWYGLSPVEAAAYSIDQHNQSSAWNQALLQNGARPSGALVVKHEQGGALSPDQYYRLKQQMDEQFSGAANAGRPILLEGGLEWREMSLSPKDMDFIEAKHSAARDIALAFGVPPQLLGIPGDNTYANLAEARLSLWEQTIMPLVASTAESMSGWLSFYFEQPLRLEPDADQVSALAAKREALWERVKGADFLTHEEKRAMLGL